MINVYNLLSASFQSIVFYILDINALVYSVKFF